VQPILDLCDDETLVTRHLDHIVENLTQDVHWDVRGYLKENLVTADLLIVSEEEMKVPVKPIDEKLFEALIDQLEMQLELALLSMHFDKENQ